ncbi:hypothetical protein [Streptomyces sp. NPDC057682]|uniref:hypothetical protein n=1 Tax=Streptomyces sp. NPDC057682 TaxID=3346210 RepID=UPI0036AA60E2
MNDDRNRRGARTGGRARRTVFGALAAACLAAAVAGAGGLAPSDTAPEGTRIAAVGFDPRVCDVKCVANGWQRDDR